MTSSTKKKLQRFAYEWSSLSSDKYCKRVKWLVLYIKKVK